MAELRAVPFAVPFMTVAFGWLEVGGWGVGVIHQARSLGVPCSFVLGSFVFWFLVLRFWFSGFFRNVLTTFLRHSSSLARDLFANHLVRRRPTFSRFRLRRVDGCALCVRELGRYVFFRPFPLRGIRFLLTGRRVHFLDGAPRVERVVRHISRPRVANVKYAGHLNCFVVSSSVPNFVRAVFATNGDNRRVISVRVWTRPVTSRLVHVFRNVHVVRNYRAIFPKGFLFIFFTLYFGVGLRGLFRVEECPIVLK